ncbi:MAG: hypothetical protein ABI345_07380 [Jatrophihabitans sp.]
MTDHITGNRTVAGISMLCAVSIITACSSSAAGSKPRSSASRASGSAGAVAPGAAADSDRATCSQVTKSQVQPLLVAAITSATTAVPPVGETGAGGTGQRCTFATSDSAQALSILVIGGKYAENFYQSQVQSTAQAVSVPGVGTKAIRDASHSSTAVTAERRGVVCVVDTSGADQLPGVAALEKAAGDSNRIGDSNWVQVAAALGTLCNVVFGSGNTTPDFSGLEAAAATASAAPSTGGGLPTNITFPTDAPTS